MDKDVTVQSAGRDSISDNSVLNQTVDDTADSSQDEVATETLRSQVKQSDINVSAEDDNLSTLQQNGAMPGQHAGSDTRSSDGNVVDGKVDSMSSDATSNVDEDSSGRPAVDPVVDNSTGRDTPGEADGRSKLKVYLVAVLRTAAIMVNNLWVIPTYIIWCYLLLPLRWIAPTVYQRVEQVPFCWLEHFVAHWIWSAGYSIVESGDDVAPIMSKRHCLFVANHQSTADVPIVMSLMSDAKKHPVGQRLFWIMDVIFRFTHFGWISSFHGDFFIRQGRDTRKDQLTELKCHLEDVYLARDRTCTMVFPEGGFLHKRRATSQEYGRKHGYPVLQHVTLPRIGAMQTVIDTLAPSSDAVGTAATASGHTTGDSVRGADKRLEWFIDATIAYPEGRPLDVLNIFFGNRPPCQTIIHYRCYPISELPRTSDGLLHWVYERWAEKDQMLDTYYKTGRFPSGPDHVMRPMTCEMMTSRNSQSTPVTSSAGEDPTALRPLSFNLMWCLTLNSLFLLSSYIHWWMFSSIWALAWKVAACMW